MFMKEEEEEEEEGVELNKCSSSSVKSRNDLSMDGKKRKRSVKRCGTKSVKEKNSIPIFTDAFLDLFRKQKSEIRSLKLIFSQLSERFKLKDAQQEQIRLDNQKMRLDIEEICQKNHFFLNQINEIEQEFQQRFNQDFNQAFLSFVKEHQNDQELKQKLQNIIQTLQL